MGLLLVLLAAHSYALTVVHGGLRGREWSVHLPVCACAHVAELLAVREMAVSC